MRVSREPVSSKAYCTQKFGLTVFHWSFWYSRCKMESAWLAALQWTLILICSYTLAPISPPSNFYQVAHSGAGSQIHKSVVRIRGYGSGSGSYKNVTDPQHWFNKMISGKAYIIDTNVYGCDCSFQEKLKRKTENTEAEQWTTVQEETQWSKKL